MSGYSRTISADLGAIDRSLRALERSLERVASPSIAWQSADRVGEAVASALGSVADRFRHGADEAAKFGSEATQLGNTALQRLAEEVARRPLTALVLAAGVGFLLGAAGRRA